MRTVYAIRQAPNVSSLKITLKTFSHWSRNVNFSHQVVHDSLRYMRWKLIHEIVLIVEIRKSNFAVLLYVKIVVINIGLDEIGVIQ